MADAIKDRVMSATYFFAAFIACLVIVVFEWTLYKFLRKFLKCICCTDKSGQVAPEDRFGTYKTEYNKMSLRMIASYDIRVNDKYTDIIKAIDAGKQMNDNTERNAKATNQTLEIVNEEKNKLKEEEIL